MKEVEINGKKFTEMIPLGDLNRGIAELADRICKAYEGRDPLVIGILNGSFLFAADLLRAMDWDPEIQFMRLSSYKGGMNSSGHVRILLDLDESVEGRDILIVEDIVDTGTTIEWLRNYLVSKGAKSVQVATLLFKEAAFKAATEPEFISFTIPNRFVVGYGMDFGERGRSLKTVYHLVD